MYVHTVRCIPSSPPFHHRSQPLFIHFPPHPLSTLLCHTPASASASAPAPAPTPASINPILIRADPIQSTTGRVLFVWGARGTRIVLRRSMPKFSFLSVFLSCSQSLPSGENFFSFSFFFVWRAASRPGLEAAQVRYPSIHPSTQPAPSCWWRWWW